jgi:Aldo/keto reductase family
MRTVTLNNGVAMPIIGFGVFQIPEDQTQAAVEAALEAGYRLLDTAASYDNEQAVGAAIAARASGARTSSSPPNSGSSTPRSEASRMTPSAPSTIRCAGSASTTSICT